MKLKTMLWMLLWSLRTRWRKDLDVGKYFPDFALKDSAGRRHALSDSPADKLTVLWFTNLCEDCRGKIPLLEELARQAGDGYRVLAVSILGNDESLPRQVGPSCGFPLLLDPQDIVSCRLGLVHSHGACPLFNLFIVDASRRILFRRHLSAMHPDEFRSQWRRLLEQRRC